MPTVRIDEEVYDELKKKAEPFVDTPNTVLRRLLGLNPKMAEVSDLADTADLGAEPAPAREPSEKSRKRKPASRKAKARPRSARQTKRPKGSRVPSGDLLPEVRYELPLLRALIERGGSAPSREVVEAVGQALSADLTDVDRQKLRSGGIRWQSRIAFVRLRLVERGLLSKDSPRGIWAVTDDGRTFAEASHA